MSATKVKSQPTAKRPQKAAKTAPKKAQAAPKKTATKTPTATMFAPTQEQRNLVVLAQACSMPEAMIVDLIINPKTKRPISKETLQRCFRNELENGRQMILMKVAGTMVSIATDRNHKSAVTAGIWLQKVWGRMREPEPEWSEKKRAENELADAAEDGDIEIEATLILEEPTPPPLPAPPNTLQ
jgi:hypothetical protein